MSILRACAGSAIGLTAGSQSRSVCVGTGFSIEMELCAGGKAIGANGSRSPLPARLTEMVTTVALSAVTGLVSTVTAPATKQLKAVITAKSLSLLPEVLCMQMWGALGCDRSLGNGVQNQQADKYGRQR